MILNEGFKEKEVFGMINRLRKCKQALRKFIEKVLAPIRRSKLNSTNFTIISNNCWAGRVYQRYGLSYTSPTVGLFFWAEDYVRFISKLRYYMSLEISMIPATESKHYDMLVKRNQLPCPVGKLDDVEVVFLHYKTDKEAIEKWERRKKRINWDNLYIKFSMMNCCAEEHLDVFKDIDYEAKVVFVNNKELTKKGDCFVFVPGFEYSEDIDNDTNHYADYFDINYFLNNKKILVRKTPKMK